MTLTRKKLSIIAYKLVAFKNEMILFCSCFGILYCDDNCDTGRNWWNQKLVNWRTYLQTKKKKWSTRFAKSDFKWYFSDLLIEWKLNKCYELNSLLIFSMLNFYNRWHVLYLLIFFWFVIVWLSSFLSRFSFVLSIKCYYAVDC